MSNQLDQENIFILNVKGDTVNYLRLGLVLRKIPKSAQKLRKDTAGLTDRENSHKGSWVA